MKPTFQENGVEIYQGDCREVLRSLPDESVHCVVTSPPYWGLRDYGTASWNGGSAECDHVSRPNESAKSKTNGGALRDNPYRSGCGKCGATRIDRQIGLEDSPVKYIATMREVFAEVRRVLRSDGTLWLNMGDSYCGPNGRSSGGQYDSTTLDFGAGTIAARNCPTNRAWPGLKAKDLVGVPWMLAFALREDGWYLRSDIIWSKPNPMPESVTDRPTKAHEYIFLLSKSEKYFYNQDAIAEPCNWPEGSWGRSKCYDGDETGKLRSFYGNGAKWEGGEKRNRRSVWEVTTQPFPEAHFATFPEDLIKPCILAGCVEGGAVLDPFGGSGTTAKVARELHCKAILVELNPDYIAIAARRLSQHVFNFAENRAGGVAPA